MANPGTAPWSGAAARSGPPIGPSLPAATFAEICGNALTELPLPGSGSTWARFHALASFGQEDLVLARLVEGHTDALAILAELEGPAPPPASIWGVWAAEPPTHAVQATLTGTGWRLNGTKAYCSGAFTCTHALVTARAEDGRRLFAVEVAGAQPVPGSWPAVGMAGSDSLTMVLTDLPGTPVGPPGAYLSRPGFWHGACGVAAVWYGGAVGIGRAVLRAGPRLDAHGRAHLGAIDAGLAGMRAMLRQAAEEIDQDPADAAGQGAIRAGRVRAVVEEGATAVLAHAGRALGAGPLCHDAAHARRVADLTVFLRQSHAERDLAALADGLLGLPAPGW